MSISQKAIERKLMQAKCLGSMHSFEKPLGMGMKAQGYNMKDQKEETRITTHQLIRVQ